MEKAQATNAQPLKPRNNVATMPMGVVKQSTASKHDKDPDRALRHNSERPRRWLLSLVYECRRKLKIKRTECVCATSDYQLIFPCYEIRLAQLPCWEKQYSSFEMEGLFGR